MHCLTYNIEHKIQITYHVIWVSVRNNNNDDNINENNENINNNNDNNNHNSKITYNDDIFSNN